MSDIESSAPAPTDSGALLGKLISNPDLMRNLSALLGTSGAGTAEQTATGQTATAPPSPPPLENPQAMTDGISRVLANPEMMAKLPEVMKMLAPMMQQVGTPSTAAVPTVATPAHGGGERDRRGCRNDLLVALKPFLSPERCRAIDMLLGLSRLGDALQKMI